MANVGKWLAREGAGRYQKCSHTGPLIYCPRCHTFTAVTCQFYYIAPFHNKSHLMTHNKQSKSTPNSTVEENISF